MAGKSNAGLKKRSSRSTICTKTESHLAATKHRKSSEYITDNNFGATFQEICSQLNVEVIPLVKIIQVEPLPGQFLLKTASHLHVKSTVKTDLNSELKHDKSAENVLLPTVLTIYDVDDQKNLNMIIFKNFKVELILLQCLKSALYYYVTLKILKLEFCNLTHTEVAILQTILQENHTIVELSVNGNPNPYQNFYILLENTTLLEVSMSFCRINNRGAKSISKSLSVAFESTITSLNLASNFISDDGASYLSEALRINRCLLSLNLADNWLTDSGCVALMNVLQTFALKHEEIVIRRRRKIELLLKEREVVKLKETPSSQSITSTAFSVSQTSKTRRRSKDQNSSRIGHSSQGSLVSKKKLQKDEKNQEINSNWSYNQAEQTDHHPFIKNCIVANGEVYCGGNLTLYRLNLAYNKLTLVGLQAIIAMLKYQKSTTREGEKGILQIIIKGNRLENNVVEMKQLHELFTQEKYPKRASIASKSSYSQKRPSTSRQSVYSLQNQINI